MTPATRGSTATNATSVRTIHLVAHETQNKFLNEGGLGDEEIFRGILDNGTGTTEVGIFAGMLSSVSSNDATTVATVDLQLPGVPGHCARLLLRNPVPHRPRDHRR